MLDLNYLPRTIGKYKLCKKIGSGATSSVFLAEHLEYNRFFAAKAVNLEFDAERTLANSFSSEYNAVTTLDHPGVIRPYDVFSDKGVMFLILEYCPNGTLLQCTKTGHGLDLNKIVVLFKQIVSALAYCHERNLAHRDIKPSNILIDAYGRPKLADFGLSKKMEIGDFVRTFEGSLVYAAPELLLKEDYDPIKADIWSLGVTMYQTATGSLPWSSRNHQDLRFNIINCRIIKNPSIDRRLFGLIKRMLSVNPALRPSASQILEDLSNIQLIGRPLPTKSVSMFQIIKPTAQSCALGDYKLSKATLSLKSTSSLRPVLREMRQLTRRSLVIA